MYFVDGTDYRSRGGFPFVRDQHNNTGMYLVSNEIIEPVSNESLNTNVSRNLTDVGTFY